MNPKRMVVPVVGVLCTAIALGPAGVAAEEARSHPLPHDSETVNLDPAEFTTRIDNPYWPMKPHSRWVYRETAPEGTRQRVVVTVTDKDEADRQRRHRSGRARRGHREAASRSR